MSCTQLGAGAHLAPCTTRIRYAERLARGSRLIATIPERLARGSRLIATIPERLARGS